jgi:hypothetical protein
MARVAAGMAPVYGEEQTNDAAALRLAADIMVCHTAGEDLSMEDDAFMYALTQLLYRPVVEYAAQSTAPDYASNAEALRREIAARGLPIVG